MTNGFFMQSLLPPPPLLSCLFCRMGSEKRTAGVLASAKIAAMIGENPNRSMWQLFKKKVLNVKVQKWCQF
jgi:hypothetical protein